jgi:hypothetical protein
VLIPDTLRVYSIRSFFSLAYSLHALVRLFKVNLYLARGMIFMIDGINRVLEDDSYYFSKGFTLNLILTDLPTLFFMTSFSIFIYYFAKLTMQVESFKSNTSYYAAFLDDGKDGNLEDKRQKLLPYSFEDPT